MKKIFTFIAASLMLIGSMGTVSAGVPTPPNVMSTQNLVPTVCTALVTDQVLHADYVWLSGDALVEFGKRVEPIAGPMPSVIHIVSFPHPTSSQKPDDVIFMTFYDKDGCSLGQGSWTVGTILIGLNEKSA